MLSIVVVICALFLFYNINESNNTVVSIQSEEVELAPLQKGELMSVSGAAKFYVVGDSEKELYGDIYRNVCRMLEDIKVSWQGMEQVGNQELAEDNAVLIFCDDVIQNHVDLQKLVSFIHDGGKVVFAAGIAEAYDDAYLMPVLGITEKTIRVNYTDFRFLNDFFPVQEERMAYDGYSMSTWISVRDAAEVYVEDFEKGTPLVYTYPYGDGTCLVLNTTILADQRCMGFLSSGLGVLLEDFVYPVMGVECVFLDNFPIVTNTNDALCMKFYGRTTEAFVRDVVWPVFKGIALRNDLKYTSSVLSVSSLSNDFPAVSDSLFSTMGRSALQYNGELAYASLCQDAQPMYTNDAFITNFAKVFHNYRISSLICMESCDIDAIVNALDADIRTVRGDISAEDDAMRLSAENAYCTFPCATEGTDLDGGALLTICSVFSSHGMISHKFDINDYVAIDESHHNWDANSVLLGEFESRVFSRFDGLESMTLSHTVNPVTSYDSLSYAWSNRADTLTLTTDQFSDGQAFMVRTNGRITDISGADYTQLSDNYYMLRIRDPEVILHITRGE